MNREALSQGFKIFSIVPWEQVFIRRGDKDLDRIEARLRAREQERAQGQQMPAAIPQQPAEAQPQIHESGSSDKNIATGCTACSLGHFSTTAALLNEAYRFREKGIGSDEIADRIAMSLSEQNGLERVDLTPEKLQTVPEWERPIAEEALQKSRSLRHKLENIKSINELEEAAAEASDYYKNLNRQWFKQRIQNMNQEDKAKVTEKAMQKLEEEQG